MIVRLRLIIYSVDRLLIPGGFLPNLVSQQLLRCAAKSKDSKVK